MSGAEPCRGDVWKMVLNPVRGPALVVSVDLFNHGPAGLLIVLPITSKAKGIPFHVEVRPPEGGLSTQSFIRCEDVRSISRDRVRQRRGRVSSATLSQVEDRLRILFSL